MWSCCCSCSSSWFWLVAPRRTIGLLHATALYGTALQATSQLLFSRESMLVACRSGCVTCAWQRQTETQKYLLTSIHLFIVRSSAPWCSFSNVAVIVDPPGSTDCSPVQPDSLTSHGMLSQRRSPVRPLRWVVGLQWHNTTRLNLQLGTNQPSLSSATCTTHWA